MNNVSYIFDFNAVAKHSYHATKTDGIYCEQTGKMFPSWNAAVATFMSLYFDDIFNNAALHQIYVCHDGGTEYRSLIHPEYKANRVKDSSPILLEQLDKFRKWLKAFFKSVGVLQIHIEGVEADDIIAWLCTKLDGVKNVYTVDADLLTLAGGEFEPPKTLQLSSLQDVIVYLKKVPYTKEDTYKGVPLKYVSIVKALLGDTSDNYGGIKGFGIKALDKMIEDYKLGSLEAVRRIAEGTASSELWDKVQGIQETGRVKPFTMIRECLDGTLNDSYNLSKLHPELCEKPFIKTTFLKRVPDTEQVQRLCDAACIENIFSGSLLNKRLITGSWLHENLDEFIEGVCKSPIVAFDYETTDKTKVQSFREASGNKNFVDVLSQELTGISLCFGRNLEHVVYIPIDHKYSDNASLENVKRILESAIEHCQLVAHNAFFEGFITKKQLGLSLKGVHDTRILQRYVDENSEAGLKFMSSHYLDYKQTTYEEVVGDKDGMSSLTADEAFEYGTDDAMVTAHLYVLMRLLTKLDGQWDFVTKYAVDPTVVLQHSYENGVTINWELQKRLQERDESAVSNGMAKLRSLLKDNVTGEVTEGCLSFIKAEEPYFKLSTLAKLTKGGIENKRFSVKRSKTLPNGSEEETTHSIMTNDESIAKCLNLANEWKEKMKAACKYLEYEEVKVYKESLTLGVFNEAAKSLGFIEVPSFSAKSIKSWLKDVQYPMCLEWVEAKQRKFLKLVDELSQLKTFTKPKDDKLGSEEAYKRDTAFFNLLTFCNESGVLNLKTRSVGDELNIGSPIQMQQLMFCKIGVPVSLYGKAPGEGRKAFKFTDGAPSTDEISIRTSLANYVKKGSWQEEALLTLLEVKAASTRLSLYHKAYPLWKHVDGKIHPQFTDAGTDTRRPTGSSPNVLQVSKKDKSMRSLFVPPNKDYVTVAIDYNGQELRILACQSEDKVMIDAYDLADEKDLHSVTGSGIAKLKADQTGSKDLRVLSDFRAFDAIRSNSEHHLCKLANDIRKHAKGCNFGLAYGAGPSTISRNLIVPFEEAKELLEGTMNLYSGIPIWQKKLGDFMVSKGYVETAFGTKRHAKPDIRGKDNGAVERQKRQGANFTIQGTAAEMLRIVLTGMVSTAMLSRLRMQFFAPIYDEIVSFVHKDDVVQYCEEMHTLMQNATPKSHVILQQPEISIGPDWGRVHELGRWGKEATKESIESLVVKSLKEAEEMWENDLSNLCS